MRTELERILLAISPEKWTTRQAVVFDWHDGPREGLCELEFPACCFYFEIVAERWHQNRFHDRIFRISGVEQGSVARAISAFCKSHEATRPIWAPHGDYESDEEQRRVEDCIDEILSKRVPSRLLARTMDMIVFREIWLETSFIEPSSSPIRNRSSI